MVKWKTKSGYIIYRVLSKRCNTYLLTNGDNKILIDTSINREWNSLLKKIDNIINDEKKLETLILTHVHFDHVMNAKKLKTKYNLKIIVHKDEAEFLTRGSRPLPKGSNPITKFLTNIVGDAIFPFHKFDSVENDILVDKKFELNDYGFNAYIMNTPGHTKGSVSIIVDDQIAIVGDAMVGVSKKNIFPPFADKPELIVDSWNTLYKTGCELYLPSHGNKITQEELKLQIIKNIKK